MGTVTSAVMGKATGVVADAAVGSAAEVALDVLGVLAAVGAGLVGGVFFAFSVAIMPAFARLPAGHGVAVMQSINITIVRPPFLVVFVGTVLTCVLRVLRDPTDPVVWLGAALYVLGGFVLTMVANVPLNNRLMTVDPAGAPAGDGEGGDREGGDREGGAPFWAHYAARWTLWNHVRTVACLGAAVALTLAA